MCCGHARAAVRVGLQLTTWGAAQFACQKWWMSQITAVLVSRVLLAATYTTPNESNTVACTQEFPRELVCLSAVCTESWPQCGSAGLWGPHQSHVATCQQFSGGGHKPSRPAVLCNGVHTSQYIQTSVACAHGRLCDMVRVSACTECWQELR
jgi:hypothetical protein